MTTHMTTHLTSRVEFRAILKDIVVCLREDLDKPTLLPLTSEEIHFWLHEVTMDDVRAVVAEIEAQAQKDAA